MKSAKICLQLSGIERAIKALLWLAHESLFLVYANEMPHHYADMVYVAIAAFDISVHSTQRCPEPIVLWELTGQCNQAECCRLSYANSLFFLFQNAQAEVLNHLSDLLSACNAERL